MPKFWRWADQKGKSRRYSPAFSELASSLHIGWGGGGTTYIGQLPPAPIFFAIP
ncbi:hypothetical protein [Hymenobacter sp. APR13]|uniref:hypothetical protein n=1 Tax=Hymenobacter sp. APR13 TaxID=1356852 RepID=UPI000B1AD907|nr:hypothetical protein [Hymenobacter sp. APR13]